MSKREKQPDSLACRRNKVGGQAVLEGVMMKSGEKVCIAVRKPDGSIAKRDSSFVSVRKKHKILFYALIGFLILLLLIVLMIRGCYLKDGTLKSISIQADSSSLS